MITSSKNYNKFRTCHAALIFILISLSLTGSECEKLITNAGIPQEMVGSWELMEQTGALQDICPNETISFQSNGVAILTCPNSNSILRNFEVSNNVLTYTQTSVSYGIETLNNNELFLVGQKSVSRNLKYQRIITYNNSENSQVKTDFNNSSEARR